MYVEIIPPARIRLPGAAGEYAFRHLAERPGAAVPRGPGPARRL